MNLLDMLAGDPPQAIYKTEESPTTVLGVLETKTNNETDSNDGVHYLPTVLTPMQRDICEIIVQIMRHHLTNGVESRRNRASINSLLETAESSEGIASSSDSYDMIKLLFDQLCIASRHPSLLVDHLMPKKLLLLETNQRLLNLSGNLKLFNEIIDGIIDTLRYSSKTEVFNILVIAENVKELELVEGIIIGKQLYYKNLSSGKMYEDNRGMPLSEQIEEEPKSKKRRFISRKPQTGSAAPCLYLTTTQQFYNHYTPASLSGNSAFNLIFSFDQTIDCDSPSIEVLRNVNNNGRKTPILIPVPVMSILHVLTQIAKPAGNLGNIPIDRSLSPAHKWRIRALNVYAVNRFNLFEQSVTGFYRKHHQSMIDLYNWITDPTVENFPDFGIQEFSNLLNLNFTDEKLMKKLRVDYLENLAISDGEMRTYNYGEEVRSYKDFKYTLSVILNERIGELEATQKSLLSEQLTTFRNDESKRQLEIDRDEDLIAAGYREMKALIDKANIAERLSARVDADIAKVRQKNEDLKSRKRYLEDNVKSATEEIVANQKANIAELEKELNNVAVVLEKLNGESDETRFKYQESSATAAKLSGELSELQEKNIKLQQKVTGPGARLLPTLFKDDSLHKIEAECYRIEQESKVIEEMFAQKLDTVIKERNGILDSSGGSSSRQVNRISRSATPM